MAAIEAKNSFCRFQNLALSPRRHLFTKSRATSLNHPVKHAVLNRFAYVDGADDLGALNVGDRAGDLEDARVGAGAQSQAPEG